MNLSAVLSLPTDLESIDEIEDSDLDQNVNSLSNLLPLANRAMARALRSKDERLAYRAASLVLTLAYKQTTLASAIPDAGNKDSNRHITPPATSPPQPLRSSAAQNPGSSGKTATSSRYANRNKHNQPGLATKHRGPDSLVDTSALPRPYLPNLVTQDALSVPSSDSSDRVTRAPNPQSTL